MSTRMRYDRPRITEENLTGSHELSIQEMLFSAEKMTATSKQKKFYSFLAAKCKESKVSPCNVGDGSRDGYTRAITETISRLAAVGVTIKSSPQYPKKPRYRFNKRTGEVEKIEY